MSKNQNVTIQVTALSNGLVAKRSVRALRNAVLAVRGTRVNQRDISREIEEFVETARSAKIGLEWVTLGELSESPEFPDPTYVKATPKATPKAKTAKKGKTTAKTTVTPVVNAPAKPAKRGNPNGAFGGKFLNAQEKAGLDALLAAGVTREQVKALGITHEQLAAIS